MKRFEGRTAVITGAGSGFGLEVARLGARRGMNLVLADVQQDALDRAAEELRAAGAAVLAQRLDVSKGAEIDALGAAVAAPEYRAVLEEGAVATVVTLDAEEVNETARAGTQLA
jgi:NADP-dependent 3-hydroxy acid dehydrogenase YdfG